MNDAYGYIAFSTNYGFSSMSTIVLGRQKINNQFK